MALTLRLIKGSPLTHQELDDNFSELQGFIDDINTATGSFLYSGSFDGSSTLTLYSGDTNYSIDLSALSGGGGSADLTSLNAFTGSIQIEVDSLTAATSSYLTADDTGSFLFSGSYDSSTDTITLYSIDGNYDLDLSDLAGGSTDISALNTFTGSIQTEVDSLTAATGSYLTADDTGSFLYSGSYDSSTNTVTLYSVDGDYDLDISDLAGGSTDITALNAHTSSINTYTGSLVAFLDDREFAFWDDSLKVFRGTHVRVHYANGGYAKGVNIGYLNSTNNGFTIYETDDNPLGQGEDHILMSDSSGSDIIIRNAGEDAGNGYIFIKSDEPGASGEVVTVARFGGDEKSVYLYHSGSNVFRTEFIDDEASIIVSGSISGSKDVFFSGLPNTTTPNIVGFDTATGQLSYYSTGSFGGGSSTDISALNTFTGSIQTEVDNLTAATSSYLTDIDTGSLYYSSSVDLNTITFYQGDGTTESVTVDTGSGGGGDSNLVLELISNQTVGGVTSGDTFAAGDSIESVLRSILISYIEPVLSNFLIKLNGSTVSTIARDVGNSFTMNTASFSATVDDPDGNYPVSASVTASGADIGTQQIYLSDSLSSTNNLGLGTTLTINRASTAGTVTFRVNTESETTADTQTITTSVPFYWRNYLAASATDIIDSSTATNVVDAETVDSTLDTNKSWTATCNSNNDDQSKYTYIIYPASYGDLSEVTQDGAQPVLTAFTKQADQIVQNAYGAQTTFRIYKSNQEGAFDAGVELTIS